MSVVLLSVLYLTRSHDGEELNMKVSEAGSRTNVSEDEQHEYTFLVVKAEGIHLFPYRTQKLSPLAAMVLPHLVVGE